MNVPGGVQPIAVGVRRVLTDMATFSRVAMRLPLRSYQLEPLRVVLAAVMAQAGGTWVVEFARQSGKDEAVAQLLAFLLLYYKNVGGRVVLAAPSAGQSAISKQRLRERLDNPFTGPLWRSQGAYSLMVGRAAASFLTAASSANTRGHTASLLLIGNEAQDIEVDVWDSRFAPMAASTNAPTLFLGTPWSSNSLLARAMRQARVEQAADGVQHVYKVDWVRVAEEVPAYRQHVEQRAAQLGWQHPFIKTEYQLIELDEGGGMFDAHRRGQMVGGQGRFPGGPPNPLPASPTGGGDKRQYVLLLDVAGEAEAGEAEIRSANPRKDSTALTVVEVDTSGDRPRYLVRDRREWLGVKHTALLDTLLDLCINVWKCAYIVVDATGIGAGLASFLAAKLGKRVVPFVFNQATKSKLGWDFLALVESGRYKEYADDGRPDTGKFWQQVGACQFEVLSGPNKPMRWGVPDPTVHDDLLISAALTATLDALELMPRVARARGY